jgi:uncharacterized membrane protein YfcA
MGMGGGTILILLLSIFMGLDQHIAQATNIIFFMPTAISAIIIGIKNKNIMWKLAIPIVIAGTIGAAISSSISTHINVQILRKLFGIFLLIIAGFEIVSWYNVYIKEKNRHTKNENKIK